MADILGSISSYVSEGGLESFGISTNLNKYVDNLLPKMSDGTEKTVGQNLSNGYTVKISYMDWGASKPEGKVLVATMPKEIQLNFKSKWGSIVGPHMFKSSLMKAVDLGVEVMSGNRISTNKMLSIQRYEGTDPLDLDLELHFVANTAQEAQSVVMDSIATLGRLVLPTQTGAGLLRTPGPNGLSVKYTDDNGQKSSLGTDNGTRIQVLIGNYIMLDYVIIESATITIPSVLGDVSPKQAADFIGPSVPPRLLPLRAVAKVHVKTSTAFTKTELDKALNLQSTDAPMLDVDKTVSDLKDIGGKVMSSVKNIAKGWFT